MSFDKKYNSNFLVGIRLDDSIVLPTEEPQRSIFKSFLFVMLKKVQNNEWTKKEFNDWKKTLIRVDEDALCRVPEVFLKAIENEPEINRETAILVRSLNLQSFTGSLTDSDMETIVRGVKNHTIIDVFRDIITKGYQVTYKVINENFKDYNLDNLEIILEQLIDKDENPVKDKLKQTFDDNFEYVRCIAGVDQLVAISEERLIPNAISVVSDLIRSENKKKDYEIRDYQNVMQKPFYKSRYMINPWNDSSNR